MATAVKSNLLRLPAAVRYADVSHSNIFATITHKPSIEMEHRIVQNWRNGIRSGCFPEGISSNVVTQPLWEGAIRAMKKRGGNPVAIEADGPLTGIEFVPT